ncbi:hypothetical protein JXA02_13510 [candidate division KSB1 bacterium]|nr:hypothetical protein [candidate division KSB1 bacterium]RQW01393.1 MAG: hypothetical protein EH222_15250 [candidate division KSB1 bacterium]
MKLYRHSVFLLLFLSGLGYSEDFITSALHARPVAMGGAFTAMEAGLENTLFNPACMSLTSQLDNSLNVYINPIGAASAILHRTELSTRTAWDAKDWLSVVGLFVRSLSFARPVLQAAVILSEELPANPGRSGQAVAAEGILDWNYHSAAFRITLAKQVSIGFTGYCFNLIDGMEVRRHVGSSYGILMRPSETFSAGLSYFNLPDKADSLMLLQHRISNKSINLGFVYRPIRKLNLALDFRNVSEEDNNSTNEVHAGVEFYATHFIALRAGYFRQNNEKIDTFSAGCGLSDFRTFASQRERFVLSNIIVNYGVVAEKQVDKPSFIHYLTFLLRF